MTDRELIGAILAAELLSFPAGKYDDQVDAYAGRRRPASLTGRCFFGASLSASQMPRSASLS
jgi:hypothetical protein